mgnify:FL=1
MTETYAGSGEEDLGIALAGLEMGDRVFITFADFEERYPNHSEELRASELAELVARYGCEFKAVAAEKRIYFSKKSA